MIKIIVSLSVLFSILVIVACNPSSNPDVSPLSPFSTTGFVNTPKPGHTPSTIKTQTSTPKPTENSFATPTIPSGTLGALRTMDALVTKMPVLGEFYSWDCVITPCYISGLGLSPDGKWGVFFSAKESGGLSIVSIDGNKLWDIYFSEITDWTCPCGDARVLIEHWSKDGKYLYVRPIDGSDGGYEWLWRSNDQLIRINLDNGSWVDTKFSPAFSFSPNERFIAYRLGQDVVIHEFQTGNEQKFTVPNEYKAFGRFTWSPDNKKIIFVASINNLDQEEPPDGFTLYLLDLESSTITTIFEKDDRYLYPLEWLSETTILVESLFEVNNGKLRPNGEKYKLNLETNEISIRE